MKTRGAWHPAAPWGSGGVDLEEFLAAVGELERLQKRQKEEARDGRRQPGKGVAPPGQGPKNNCLDRSPEGKAKDLEELWPAGWTWRGGATPHTSPCRHRDRSRWQRELELAFQELFITNRELKKHLRLHLAPGPGGAPNTCQGQDWRGETRTDTTAVVTEAGGEPGGEPMWPAQTEAHQAESQTSLKEFLSKLKSQKYLRLAKFPSQNESEPLSPKAGVLIGKGNRLHGGTGSGQAPTRPDPLAEGPRHRAPQGRADGAGLAAFPPGKQVGSWSCCTRQAPPGLSWEAHSQAGLEEQREQRRACLARLKSCSSLDQEKEGACEHDTTSLWASSFIDDDRHSQMIRDLQQQIEKQNKLHKQFLEEARKRLQEFQRI
ncbi:LOW QUALITY PROTEIN: protein DDC8 homolog [Ailuropoda melanoleuca]|uniref:LOW QUALITY PROTEIN: protein DDC8 homolog n=1 Tax=Ailuropoda melanoleuca TaxID=9646 RepID=UPI000947B8AF|nr:LOW QUALITY PROTEIN: protein DDC8 homolog [Ailuropoda melanoleuca]